MLSGVEARTEGPQHFAPDALVLERDAVPVRFSGMVAPWPAVKLWRGESGLQRLISLAGEAHVEALVSGGDRLAGDMQHLMLLGCTLRQFLDGTLERQLAQRQPPGARGPLRLYLAQSPLLVAAAGSDGSGGISTMQPSALHPLMGDLGTPALLQQVPLSQVNFWASMRETRSSLHYDPYANLLCVVRGSKRVFTVPPSCTPHLYPLPLTSQSANHSPADLAQPDTACFPKVEAALPQLRVFELAAGDALFIPEGWWHQVDSSAGTMACNFWWEGELSRRMGGPSDSYLLRRLLQSLVEQQKQRALAELPRCNLLQEAPPAAAAPAADEAAAAALDPQQAAAVRLLAAVTAEQQAAGPGSQPPQLVTAALATLASGSAKALLDVLLELRRMHPQLAAHLLLHGLDPAGWELLSACFERRQEDLAVAGEAAEDAVSAVCDELYSVVDRQQLLEVILHRKAAFAQQALKVVLATELTGCFDT